MLLRSWVNFKGKKLSRLYWLYGDGAGRPRPSTSLCDDRDSKRTISLVNWEKRRLDEGKEDESPTDMSPSQGNVQLRWGAGIPEKYQQASEQPSLEEREQWLRFCLPHNFRPSHLLFPSSLFHFWKMLSSSLLSILPFCTVLPHSCCLISPHPIRQDPHLADEETVGQKK